MSDKDARRRKRAGAIRCFNRLAKEYGLSEVPVRPGAEEIQSLYADICEKAKPDHLDDLTNARLEWCSNGGADLDLGLLLHPSVPAGDGDDDDDDDAGIGPDGAEPLPCHTEVTSAPRKPFRLQSRAFMLTFNSLSFALSIAQWKNFRAWVVLKAAEFKAKYWNATLEESTHSEEVGRVHLHAYAAVLRHAAAANSWRQILSKERSSATPRRCTAALSGLREP